MSGLVRKIREYRKGMVQFAAGRIGIERSLIRRDLGSWPRQDLVRLLTFLRKLEAQADLKQAQRRWTVWEFGYHDI